MTRTQSIKVLVRHIWPIDQSIWMHEIQITAQGQRRTTQLKCNQSLDISDFEICKGEIQITPQGQERRRQPKQNQRLNNSLLDSCRCSN